MRQYERGTSRSPNKRDPWTEEEEDATLKQMREVLVG